MAKYQIIAKKYRPQTFKEVFEQDAIVVTLKNAILFNRIGHAYLFCGSRGTGKTTLARLFAKAINCQSFHENQEPCNTCHSCMEITSGHSLNVIEIDGASNRGIDDIRSINDTVAYAASSASYKIYIIDEVHMLTKEAFNALLKVVEEPPSHVVFFFATTEPHKVLPTIISRCQRFDLKRISQDKIVDKLKTICSDLNFQADLQALELIATHSEGSLRDAESLLDQVICFNEEPLTPLSVARTLGLVPKELFFELDQAAATKDLFFPFEITERIFQMGCHLNYFLENLTEHYKNLLLIKLGKTKNLNSYLRPDEHEKYQQSAAYYTQDQCFTILDYLTNQMDALQKSPFKRINLEIILLHIIRSMTTISIEALTKELIELKDSVLNESPKPTDLLADLKAALPVKESVEPLISPENKKDPGESTPPAECSEIKNNPAFSLQKKIKHDQIMYFASVELSGTLKKH